MPSPHDTTPLRNFVHSFLTAKHDPAGGGAIETRLDRWKWIPPPEKTSTDGHAAISHCETVSSCGCGLSSLCALHMIRVVMPIRLASLAQGRHLPRRACAAIASLALVVIAAGRSGLASDF